MQQMQYVSSRVQALIRVKSKSVEGCVEQKRQVVKDVRYYWGLTLNPIWEHDLWYWFLDMRIHQFKAAYCNIESHPPKMGSWELRIGHQIIWKCIICRRMRATHRPPAVGKNVFCGRSLVLRKLTLIVLFFFIFFLSYTPLFP